VGLLVCKGM